MYLFFISLLSCLCFISVFESKAQKLLPDIQEYRYCGHYASLKTDCLSCKAHLYRFEESLPKKKYVIAKNELKNNNEIGVVLMKNFLKKYPKNPLITKIHTDVISYFFDRKEYLPLIDYVKEYVTEYLQKEKPTNQTEISNLFKIAYAYFMQKKPEKAKELFLKIHRGTHPYIEDVNYYLAIIYYENKNYKQAQISIDFSTPKYELEANELLFKIFYDEKKYFQVINYFERMLKNNQPLSARLSFFVGEAYLEEKNYEKAEKYLKKYIQEIENIEPLKKREIYVKLAICALALDEKEAKNYLQKAIAGEDKISQLASYYLGIYYIKKGEKQLAIDAFHICKNADYYKKLQIEAYLLYIKLNYELKNFNQVIESVDFFEENFPNNKELSKTKKLKAKALQYTGNYENALKHYEDIIDNHPEVSASYQQLSYNQAIQQYNDKEYEKSLIFLKKSIAYPIDIKIRDQAYYVTGEIFNIKSNYEEALQWYKKITPNTEASSKANYSIAYILYNQKEYEKALFYFKNFIEAKDEKTLQNEATSKDAFLRMADIYFLKNEYDKANTLYDKALYYNIKDDRDYIYFQKARIEEQKKNDSKARQAYQLVLNRYPNSNYRDEIWLQKGLLELKQGAEAEAIESFSKLITSSKKISFIPIALTKRALIYKNLGNFLLASNDLKKLLHDFITHPLAEEAIKSLQDMQRKDSKMDSLRFYKDMFLEAHPESDFHIRDEFLHAKNYIFEENFEQAALLLETFISNYPSHLHTQEAYYWLGYCFEKEKKFEKARNIFAEVKDGRFIEKAVKNIADIHFETQDYQNAITEYMRLEEMTQKKKYLRWAQSQLIQCYFELKDFEKVEIYINKLGENNLYEDKKYLYKAKILIAQKEYEMALKELEKMVQNYQNQKTGAQAQYLIGWIYREKKDYKKSTEELIKVKSKYESYPHWIYKSYLLIAENYISLKNDFHAIETLKSIINYAKDSSVVSQAKEKLHTLTSDKAENE